jgi:single-stranded-DNA-specific exonuclease
MGIAVARLFQARDRGESVVLFGDYDVDGVTSCALLKELLTSMGWTVHCHLPHRLDDGYGLTQDAVVNCLARFPTTLLLAVDCGSTAVTTAEFLRARSIDVIVLDHHQVSHPRPAVLALVNPRAADGATKDGVLSNGKPQGIVPFGELCSAGLAFKLAHAIVKHARQLGLPGADRVDVRPLLDLVALGTIADLVPLRGENRILVSAGLERLNSTTRPGLRALKVVARTVQPIGVYEVGFQLAPRLNAAGRLETATTALDLICATDAAEAERLALELDSQNRERQNIERDIAEQVIAAVRTRFNPAKDFVIVEGQMFWHLGVVGIVASRVLREFYRPTIILGGDGDEWRGSGRSIEGFDLAAALRQCDDLLLRHGGHAMAAGLTIHSAKMDEFRDRLNGLARKALGADALRPRLDLDAEVSASELTVECVEQLGSLEPVGQGNPPVQVVVRNLSCRRPAFRMGKDGRHARLSVSDGGEELQVVWWNCGDSAIPTGRFDLAAVPQINDYEGRRSVQLRLLDWRPAM